MQTYHKFDDFVGQLGLALHNLNTHTLKIYLSNTQPVVGNTVKANIAEITAQHGYPSGGTDIQNLFSQAAGVGTMTGTNVVFTASGGSFGPFQFVILYNDDAANDNLIAWWDYGSAITINDTETFTVQFGANILTIQ